MNVPCHYDFNGLPLPIDFQWLRTPCPERLFTLTGRALRLHGRESIGSWFEQSLVARRQAALWRSWRPWLAAFGVALPSTCLLIASAWR